MCVHVVGGGKRVRQSGAGLWSSISTGVCAHVSALQTIDEEEEDKNALVHVLMAWLSKGRG
jgi:hypothetical protein